MIQANQSPPRCEVSGLPITQKERWTNYKAGENYFLTVRLIGSNIVWLQPQGYARLPDVKQALAFAKLIRQENLGRDRPYYQIDDWSGISGGSIRARRYYLKNLKNRRNLAGLSVYGASAVLRIGFKLHQRFSNYRFPFELVPSYAAAMSTVQNLIRVVSGGGEQVGAPGPVNTTIVEDAEEQDLSSKASELEWSFTADGFSIDFELIEGDILHARAVGQLQVEHIPKVTATKANLVRGLGLKPYAYYYLLGLDHTHSVGQKVRKAYVKSLLRFYRQYPHELIIFYGVNRLFRAAIDLSRPFVPFRVRVVKDLPKGLHLISANRTNPAGDEPQNAAGQRIQTDDSDRIEQYAVELLHCLEGVDWSADGIPAELGNDVTHPFYSVFEAIKLIKWELDDLYEQRTQSEAALRKSEEKYRAIVESSPMGIFMYKLDSDGRLIFRGANPAADKILGIDNNQFVGKTLEEAFPPLAETELPQRYRSVIKNGKPLKGEHVDYAHGQIKGIFEVHAFKTSLTHLTVMFSNITENRKLQAQLQQAQKMEAIGTLAGGIAHDFNNILAGVIGYSELVQDYRHDPQKVSEYIDHVLIAGNRAKELVRQILTFSRQESQDIKPLLLAPIIKECLKLVRASLPATIDIRQDIEDELAAMVDSTQIHQVIMNLCTNAEHAMRKKGGQLGVRLYGTSAESVGAKNSAGGFNTSVCLEISDTGQGIDPEMIERIFEPFFTTKKRDEGTGMGLSVVHGIIKSHGGTISVFSEPSRGTTFKIVLPAVDLKAQTAPTPLVAVATGNQHILLVDDEQSIVNVGTAVLKSLGYTVTASISSYEALQLFKRRPDRFDLVITDLTMPDMTGDKLAQRMLHIRPDLPIILCTGFGHQISEHYAKHIGIKMLCHKPMTKMEVALSVKSVLSNN